jgi:hypothetical protein
VDIHHHIQPDARNANNKHKTMHTPGVRPQEDFVSMTTPLAKDKMITYYTNCQELANNRILAILSILT